MHRWHRLPCDSSIFNVNVLLPAGQSFRWKRVELPKESSESSSGRSNVVEESGTTTSQTWVGVFNSKVWFVRQESNEILFQAHCNRLKREVKDATDGIQHADELREYLQIDYPIVDIINAWKQRDQNFAKIEARFLRTRVLRIEALEALFSFITSSCNNIKRIEQLIDKLCKHFGDEVCELDGERYYAFPTAKRLANANVESQLRELGFGYRAKYIAEAARRIDEEGESDFITRIRQLEYAEAQRALRSLPGVGAKVADCALLYGFARHEAVPLDTHMIAVARRRYPELFAKHTNTGGASSKRKRSGADAPKALGEAQYTAIANAFRELWGAHAGVAQAIMFAAELKNVE